MNSDDAVSMYVRLMQFCPPLWWAHLAMFVPAPGADEAIIGL